jgi:hypothetical protein
MGNQTDYFNRIGYKHTYDIGDRVIGRYKKIPFVGTVGNDRLINHTDGPEITIHLDLPMKVDNVYKLFIIVKHKDIKRLKSMDDEEPLKLPVAGSIPAKRTKPKNNV